MAKVSSEGGEVNISSIAKSTNEIKSNDKMEPILNSNKFTSLDESNQEEDEILYKDADNSSNSILQLSSSDSESTSTQCSCKSSAMKEESKRKRENKYFSKLNELATENKVFRNSIEKLIENTDAYFSCIFEKDCEPLINNDMLNLIITSLRVGQCENLIKLFKIELIEKDDNSISCKVDPKCLKDSSKYFPFTLKLVSIKGNEKVTLNIVENVIKNRKRMHTENCEDDKANSDQAISSEQSLNPFNHDNPSMTNRALCMNIELMKDHASFKEFIQQYYFNWWRYIFSLIVENSILNKESLESLYIYICGVLMKGREMLKDESSNTFGPHISLFKIKKMFNIIDKTENFSFYKRLKEYNKRYSAEANDSLNKIKEQLEKLSEEKQINISDIKIDRNSSKESKKLRRLKLWTLLRRIERDWSNTNDCRGQKLFCRGIDYTFTSGTSLEYEVPDMQNTRIIIPEDCKLEVLKDLTALQIQIVSQQKLIEVNEEQSCKEKDRIKLKAAPPNLLKIKASKGTNSCLKKVKKQNLDYYDIECDEQASIISNVLISYVTKLKNKSSSYLKDLSIINGFSWFKLNEWNKKISNHIEGVNKLTTDKLESLELKTDACREDCMNQIGEIVYGSYPKLLSNGAKSTNDKKNLKSIIHKRNLAILYILKHPVLPCKEEIKSVNDIMSFIIYEMEENERNLSKEGTVGEQCDIFLTKESILNYPFETLMKCNSTKARLFVMENWERFVCLASFANQREYKHVFGFVNLFESSLSGPAFSKIDQISHCSQEIKLHLIEKIQSKIKCLIKELTSIQMYRYLIEKDVTRKQGKTLRCKSQSSYFEEYSYQLTLIYMYILNMLKQFRFNIDKVMRAKVFCKLHSHINKSSVPKMPCLCMYLLDAKSLISCINDQAFRDKKIAIERDRYFTKIEGSEIWKMRENTKDYFFKIFKGMMQDNKYIKSIEYALKVDMTELKV